jgi:integrase
VDAGAAVWSVRLERHKTAYRGQQRVLLIGPRAREVLAPFLDRRGPDDWLFSPREAVARQIAEKRRNRKTKVQPSQYDRRKARAVRLPGPHYTINSYARAVIYALGKANTAAACDTCKPLKPAERCAVCKAASIPHWHPYQMRHNAATRLVQQFGWDLARMVLGHRQISKTRVYALDDVKKAADAVAGSG